MMSRLEQPSLQRFGPVNLSNIFTEQEPGRAARFDWSAVELLTVSTELTVGFFLAGSAVRSLRAGMIWYSTGLPCIACVRMLR